jgi:heparosan-N-sulfate-glucuronate 5-epimerase
MIAGSQPDLSTEQAAPWRVWASRRRVQPGLLRTAGSFRQPLGTQIEPGGVRGYYIDLRPKAESLRWPPEWWCRHEEQEYIAVSQLGLGCFERFLAGEGDAWLTAACRTADYLLEQQQRGGPRDGSWLHLWAYPHTFVVRPPWVSAMAQGEAASLFVRLHRETGAERFAEAARRALRPLEVPSSAGGVRAELGGPFFEETPTDPPSFILNGAMFALWGCYDVGVGLGDADASRLFREGSAALAANLHRWDTGWWSRYDLYPHPTVNLANPFYHRLHIDQLRAMHLLTDEPAFAAAAARFEGYAASRAQRVRAYAGKVLFRILSPRSQRVAAVLPWARHPRSAAARRLQPSDQRPR